MCGFIGIGKISFVENYLKEIVKNKFVLNDWVYVYNFVNFDLFIVIFLLKGMGKVFKKDMIDFLEFVINDLKKVFNSEEYENDKNNIYNEYQEKRIQFLDRLVEEVREYDFEIKYILSGVYFIFIVNGRVILEEEYFELEKIIRDEIEKKVKKF